jgi:hypothetical protein
VIDPEMTATVGPSGPARGNDGPPRPAVASGLDGATPAAADLAQRQIPAPSLVINLSAIVLKLGGSGGDGPA